MLSFYASVFFSFSLVAQSDSTDFYREEIDFDFAWRFYFGDIVSPTTTTTTSSSGVVPAPATPSYNDTNWQLIDAPHDAMIGGTFSQDAGEQNAYLPSNVSWYRKHFSLPDEWQGKTIWIYFDGVYRSTDVWLNGLPIAYHESGYTSFFVRLDNVSGIAENNVIALQTKPLSGEQSPWYEGSGLYRHVRLIATNRQHIIFDGVYCSSKISGTIEMHDSNDPSKGLYADSSSLLLSAQIINEDMTSSVDITVEFRLFDGDNLILTNSTTVSLDPGEIQTANSNLIVTKAELWSLPRPYLYRLETVLLGFGGVIDSVNTTIGMRLTHWDPNRGYSLNNEHVPWRGFSNVDNFAGVGTGIPDRIHLFRAQLLRSIGGNAWRTVNNPPSSALLDVLDQVGVLAWIENRHFENDTQSLGDEVDTVRRDRNHPSVVAWSICWGDSCNEPDPQGKNIANEFKSAILQYDPYGTVTASVDASFNFFNGLSGVVNVLGLSYPDTGRFNGLHQRVRFKPALASECCQCPSFRGEEVYSDDPNHPRLSNFNADCLNETNAVAMSIDWVSGEIAWTLCDYLGEAKPFLWPQISSATGAFDLAGFPKAAAFWYQAWWLYNSTQTTARPPSLLDPRNADSKSKRIFDDDNFMVHIVEGWQQDNNRPTRTIHVYTNAPSVELFANDTSQGVRNVTWLGWAQWTNVTFVAGNVTAIARNDAGAVVAQHTVETVGNQASLILYVDVPSEATGTGTALLLDGHDVGVVRATIVDAQGRVVHSGKNISFSVFSGPGRILGVGSGNPTSHEPMRATGRNAYQGLVRAFVQVTEDRSSPAWHRRRLAQIDKEGNVRTKIIQGDQSDEFDNEIVVQASASGFGTATAVIPLSTDATKHAVRTNW